MVHGLNLSLCNLNISPIPKRFHMEPSSEDTKDSGSSLPTMFPHEEGHFRRGAEDTITPERLQEIAGTEHLSISEIQALLALVSLSSSCPERGGNQGNSRGNPTQLAQEEVAPTSSTNSINLLVDACSLSAEEPVYMPSNEAVQPVPPLPRVSHRIRRQHRYSSVNRNISSNSAHSSQAENGIVRGSLREMSSRSTQRPYYTRGARRRLSWN
ncbi:uncharacterized protein LOC119919730 isoform X5 [Tachyglossus aculeatus]|uniref:uncharacterized protein LOC119919730 isoform X1 n=1 Tax=Tachyglossus aculeatus TaxID=9261 RepID=UPI0018F53B76|nr:uncharacterized protein LOC119919730 isoform X1 [Tachyglossus aculeatus]XP_038596313.1 uncharacterized protein LOC119919730 isoform X2 [Tachyglossus aculeatus]XP_038596314.1 uncharacterized protein LOC119919730 isoform X3 [Tachyglossus aculeatus]XP_038596315.1 uncharacterized protein LOC119919730 isoform X4 [Tachyglossus aculeatus]XP_038596316.1 uncharacterized protein LOC119919730 isoform X5 [Tachyglossus aculeatus]